MMPRPMRSARHVAPTSATTTLLVAMQLVASTFGASVGKLGGTRAPTGFPRARRRQPTGPQKSN